MSNTNDNAEGCRGLAIAILMQAVKDAMRGDSYARRWLASDGAHMADLADVAPSWKVQRWVATLPSQEGA